LASPERCTPYGTIFFRVPDPPFEDAQFSCASWKTVRTFEGISGLFQDAHFWKSVRIFE
jgi:hypothetical protein